MDLKRLDEIFQTVRGVPVIGGFYIGMDEEKASELSNELKEYKTEHSCEYPADLIYQYKISFDYRCFNNAYSVSAIDVTFPKGDWLKQIVELKDYFSKRFYHKEKIGGSIKDENGDFENFCFSQCDYLYRLLIFSNGKKLTVSLKARLDSADVYCALNNISQDLELEKFIRKSMFLCKETDKVNKDFNKVIPFKYGLPLFLNMGFGDPLEIADECGSLEDLPIEISSGNTVSEDFGIHYELLTDEDNRVRTIILNLRKESEGLWPLLRYIRENFREEIDFGALACDLGFSSAYLSKIFTKNKGESPIRFLTSIRMKEAKRLLADTDESIARVGELCGYPDQFYFSRTFRKEVGENPTKYRKLHSE
jgi:AraC-like DNA-binding protein